MKPIMLKRHYSASLLDLLGAAEYILYEGNKRVILCERGITAPHTHRSSSRFLLELQVVPAAHEITHLPVAVDPSQATFWREWVEPLSLASIATGCDSLMLEIHPDPPNAAINLLKAVPHDHFSSFVPKIKSIIVCIGRSC